ncbi:MAG TPA: hypothetical protein VK582_03230 [Pyrinomonadaceae bacterium]|nr:hypothetical protein [Pyrinomonadaceae bacterium]
MMSDLDEKRVIETSDQDGRENEGQLRVIGLASENSPEETIRRMRGLPERAAKLKELIRALRQRNPD